MASCEKILIAGFSGAGKSSLMRSMKASAPADWDYFDDLDQLVLKNRGKTYPSLSDLIAGVGWETFRLWERQEFEAWIKNEGKGILALGGGTVSPLILELYGKSSRLKFIYLQTSFETCWQRLINDQLEIRPLVNLGQNELRKLFLEREEVFSRIQWKISGENSLIDNSKSIWEKVGK